MAKFANQKKPAAQIVRLARGGQKITAHEILAGLFTDFFELHGDRAGSDDRAVIGGLAVFHSRPVTVIATNRGTTAAERQATHFGSPMPGGYRKALRLIKEAGRWRRPVFCFVNTPGAYPSKEAEEQGQGQAIAQALLEIGQVPTPIISIIYGEGGSGGALALACGDQVWMLENSTYSVLSPEGFASILWKDSRKAPKAAEVMDLTPQALLEKKVIEGVIPEPTDHQEVCANMDAVLKRELARLEELDPSDLLAKRQARYRKF